MTKNQAYIRYIDVMDAEHVLDWENNVEGWNTQENETPYSIFDILQLIHELSDIQKAKQARWIICEKDSGHQIGAADLTEIDFEHATASVGVLIAKKENRRSGFASQAISFIEEEARKLGIERLISTIFPGNKASIQLFEKCGFQKIGKSDDTYFIDGEYIEALLFDKWLKK